MSNAVVSGAPGLAGSLALGNTQGAGVARQSPTALTPPRLAIGPTGSGLSGNGMTRWARSNPNTPDNPRSCYPVATPGN